MPDNKTYHLFLYNSWFLIISIAGFVILGVGILYVFQGIFAIPPAVQYILLTLWIAAAFLFSSYAAAKPTAFTVDINGLSLESNLHSTSIPWIEIQSNHFFDELLLNSLKIKLKNKETISIIDFKWRGKKEIYGLLRSIHLHQTEEQVEKGVSPDNKIKTLSQSNIKIVLGIIFFIFFVTISSNLEDRGAFYTWNPIFIYFYWVLPLMTFFKLVFTK